MTNMLKLKKNERFVIAEDTVTCVEDFFNSLDRQDKSRISESWQVELDNAMRYYVVLLSLFVQPLENRHAAKKMRQQQQQSTDSLGRERERDWNLQESVTADQQLPGRDKVFEANVLRACRNQSYEVRCVMDRALYLSKDSHLGKFMW
jgi:hypothetical protein